MIDIHFHCLPGLDDGPATWKDAIDLCRLAAAQGTTTIIATPHVLRGAWLNEEPNKILALVDELNYRLGGVPRVLGGSEVYFSSDLVELWRLGRSGPLIPLAGGNHLLIEFASRLPRAADEVIYELSLMGVTVVIAHPERTIDFIEQPERLERLRSWGAKTQCTASGLNGRTGRRSVVAEFVRLGLVNFIASDAHSVDRRPPALANAFQSYKSVAGSEAAREVFCVAPQALTLAVDEQTNE